MFTWRPSQQRRQVWLALARASIGRTTSANEEEVEVSGMLKKSWIQCSLAVAHDRVTRVRGLLQAGVRQFAHCWPNRLYKLGTKAFVIWLVNNSRIAVFCAPPRSSIIMRFRNRVATARDKRERGCDWLARSGAAEIQGRGQFLCVCVCVCDACVVFDGGNAHRCLGGIRDSSRAWKIQFLL